MRVLCYQIEQQKSLTICSNLPQLSSFVLANPSLLLASSIGKHIRHCIGILLGWFIHGPYVYCMYVPLQDYSMVQSIVSSNDTSAIEKLTPQLALSIGVHINVRVFIF